MFYDELT